MKVSWRDASSSGDLNKVCELLDAGADIDALDEHGQTALMNAAHRGDVELTRLLIQRGAALNHTAKYRLTALMLAVISSRTEVVRLLVEAGADRTIAGSKGSFARTPLQYAQESGQTEIAEILRRGA
ncbi:MAG TPA: ankyrin repeat domain-containing protein [Burkholderiales bacterium]|jgi:ankyrin repeat protein|nr:ankyrin repeat domain-containing protein [Burkholderiales bacterium]